jgi:multidrug efflux pump subunit AcrA (membrane-fusion protein)
MRRLLSAFALTMGLMGVAAHAHAQESTEDRMRDALRQAVTEMRAAQDQAAQAQADLQKAQAEKADLQKQLDAAKAAPPAPTVKPDVVASLQAQLKAAQAQLASGQQINAKLQGDVQGSLALARQKDSESRQLAAAQKAEGHPLDVCKATNAKLIDVSEGVLHLYESQSFRSILLKSYEPVLGLAKVKLENLVQDYDDKIQDQRYIDQRK